MTYRDAPLPGIDAVEGTGLIATAEHSVLGTRWIYDATVDPVWIDQTIRLVLTEATADPSSKRGAGPASAVGRLLEPAADSGDRLTIEVVRDLSITGLDSTSVDHVGVLHGTWHPDGSDAPSASGALAVVRRVS